MFPFFARKCTKMAHEDKPGDGERCGGLLFRHALIIGPI
jgi:hypothetical protein